MSTEKADFWKGIALYLAIPLFTASLGFGASEKFKNDGVRAEQIRLTAEVLHLKTADEDMDAKIKSLQLDTLDRIKGITITMQELIKQNTELIAFLKAQQGIKP